MSGKAKIEGLTNSWYGFAVFSAVCSVFTNGIGVFSIAGAVIGLLISFGITFFLGRALIKKSSFTRALLIFLSGLLTILGTLAAGKATWMFVNDWSLTLLGTIGYTFINVYMNAKSFRVLMDSSVKQYMA